MIRWTEALDETLRAMREDQELTFAQIGLRMNIPKGAALGRYQRKFCYPKLGPPRSVVAQRNEPRAATTAARRYRQILPSTNPYQTDSSTPAFAHDDRHLTALEAVGPFPVLNVRRAA